MKKIISIIMFLAVALMASLPVAATENTCCHDGLNDQYQGMVDGENKDKGCYHYISYYLIFWCDSCNQTYPIFQEYESYTHTEYDDPNDHCDGYMHHDVKYCSVCGIDMTEHDWCSNPENCPSIGN